MARFETFDGISLYYEEEGQGTPVVLLHGLSASIDINWRQPGIWAALVDAGKRVIGLDARGHGQSDKPHEPEAYAHGAMARDTGAFLDHLGLEETDLVGYSMGAVTALRFAGGDRRIRRLVLGGIGGDPAKWSSSEGEARATRARQWLTGLEADDPSKIEDKVARRARRLFEARHNDLRAIAALLRASRPLAEDITLADVSAPTLVVCGDQDLTPHKLAAALPQGQALVVDGDHERVVRNPELAKAIVNFLAD